MGRRQFIAIACGMAGFAGTASAQACLSYSTGYGDTTITCPDGTAGYVHTDPGGAATGIIGGQPYAGSASTLAPPFGPAAGVPSAAYIFRPIPGVAPPAPAQPAPEAESAVLSTPSPGLTPLAQEYLAAESAKALRMAEQAAPKAAPP